MSDGLSPEHREHDLTMYVFAISAAMVGVCLTAIGILRLITSQSRVETIKTKNVRLRHLLRLIIDGSFMLALTIMVLVCAVIAYAIV
jgi:hypothetical protein